MRALVLSSILLLLSSYGSSRSLPSSQPTLRGRNADDTADDTAPPPPSTGTCANPSRSGDQLDMRYVGRLQSTGKQFDASDSFLFTLGTGDVIKGWDIGLLGLCPGDTRDLTVPPEDGYGAQGHPGGGASAIPGGATLLFHVRVNSVNGDSRSSSARAGSVGARSGAVAATNAAKPACNDGSSAACHSAVTRTEVRVLQTNKTAPYIPTSQSYAASTTLLVRTPSPSTRGFAQLYAHSRLRTTPSHPRAAQEHFPPSPPPVPCPRDASRA